jgi:ribonuclease D
MTATLHKNDIPSGLKFGDRVAIDTETMGLLPGRDKLCLVQLSGGDGHAHIVQLDRTTYKAPNLAALLANPKVMKIFHFARFDLAVIRLHLDVLCSNIYCTRTASKLARTYTDKHGLREVCRELLGIELNKQQQSSDWGAEHLNEDQLAYAANDVLFLHRIQEKMDEMLGREKRKELAYKCFQFLPLRAELDLAGWSHTDIFEH